MKKQTRIWIVLVILIAAVFVILTSTNKQDEGYTVAVVTGTTFEKKAMSFGKVKDVKLYEGDDQTLSELANGRVDAVITDRLVGLNGIKQGGYSGLKIAGDLLYQEKCAVTFNQEDDALRQAVNQALNTIINNGTYAEISKKYFDYDILEGMERPQTHPGEAAATDDSLQRVQEKGVASFAMTGAYPPFNYFNEENKLTGFDVEIAEAVCAELGVEYKPVTIAWDGIIEGLRAKRYDGIWGSMAITDERLEVVDFSDPYYISGAQLIVAEDSEIEGPQTLEGDAQ